MRLKRLARGLSQAQAALGFGAEESTYRSWELGDSMIPVAMLRKAPGVLHCSVDYLLGLPERPPMSDEARLLADAYDDTKDPELKRIDLETVERNHAIDRRMTAASAAPSA